MTPALIRIMGNEIQVADISKATSGVANYTISQRIAAGLSAPKTQKTLIDNLNYEFTKNLKRPTMFTSTFQNELNIMSDKYTFTFNLRDTPPSLHVVAKFPVRTLVPTMLFQSILAAVDGMQLDPEKIREKAAREKVGTTEIEKQSRAAISDVLEKKGITQSTGPLKQILEYADIKPLPRGTGRRRRKQKKTRRSRR